VRFYVLSLGTIETDPNSLVARYTHAYNSNRDVKHQWMAIPCWSALIETENHKIVFDLGCMPNCMDEKNGWPLYQRELMQVTVTPNQTFEAQLGQIGLTPKDIDTVVLSHVHFDHTGNIDLFKHADVYLPKEDWIAALMATHENVDAGTKGSYPKRFVETLVKQVHPIAINEDFELFPGIEVITLPGHCPGVIGMVIHLENDKPLILASDSAILAKNYGPPAQFGGKLYDSIAYFKSIEKLHKLQEKYDAVVLFGHDPEQFSKLRKIPEYYS
jgi:glyoxylase-like metal-dependent hydrolase (beta-lactamase superfamily II)